MLKKLRIKFIALNMATVAVVLTVVFTTICVVNHRQSVATVDGALNQAIAQAAEHQGRQMGKDALGEGQPAPDDGGADDPAVSGDQETSAQVAGQAAGFAEADAAVGREDVGADALAGSADQELAVADSSDVAAPPTIGGRERDGGQVIPMALFSVSVDGAMTALGRYNTASISQDVLEQAGQQLAGADEGFGSLSDLGLFYVKRQGLVGDLLALAKMDEEEAAAQSGAARPAFEEVDLSDVLEGEVLQFESVAFERGVKLESQVEPGIELRGNEQRLRRLAGTLIDNACKYVDDGGAVDVSLSRSAKQARLAVRNTGAPISPEDLPHVFDRFYRADKARTGSAGGHGLGLAIARAIAEEHGGTLTVSSTQAEGTVFTATLPLK